MHISSEKLEEIILKTNIIERADFEEAKKEAQRSGQTLVNVLLGREGISEKFLVEILSSYFRVPATELKGIEEKREAVRMIPENFAKKKSLAIFDFDEKKRVLKVAMTDPGDMEVIEYLEAKFDCAVEPYVVSSEDLKKALTQYKEQIGDKFSQIISENIKRAETISGEIDLTKVAEEVPVVAILDAIIEYAIDMAASDIHFEPLLDALLVRYRIDGVMREILTLPKIVHSFLVARVKILANLSIDEHRKPQDGRFKFTSASGTLDIRVSIIPLLRGEKIEMRILQSSERPLSLTDLGLEAKDIEVIEENIKKTYGMILSTGPTGCGKTTTLYTILNLLNKPKVNIVTIEDPVEYDIPRINQVQVNEKAGITFAGGLRSIVRQDPDIIMVGEIRDSETTNIAIHAALTGHLVLSTIHTNDAAGTVPRLLDLGAEPFLAASTLNLIIAQRLVRRICLSCIESYKPSPEIQKLITAQFGSGNVKVTVPSLLYKGKGCKVCGYRGYKGRIGIFECLSISKEINKLILERADSSAIRAQAIKDGMTTMAQDGLRKVEAGLTTIEEVLRVIRV